MAYNKTNWEDAPSTNTPINANNLNKMEQGIYENSVSLENLIIDSYSTSDAKVYPASYINNIVEKNNAKKSVMPSSDQVISGDGWYIVDDMSISLQTKGKPILVSYSMAISNSSGSPTFGIFVDGVAKYTVIDSPASIHNTCYTTILTDIEAGTHTIDIRANRNNASSVTIVAYVTKNLVATEL